MIARYLLIFFLILEAQGNLKAPQPYNVSSDLPAKRIWLSWTGDISLAPLQNVSYDIEVYHTGQQESVHYESVDVQHMTGTHHWHWTSPLPLECLPHSLRLRVRHNDDLSDWTDYLPVPGSGIDNSKLSIFPQDDVVLVGSQKKFCCILPDNVTQFEFFYNGKYSMLSSVDQTYIYELTMNATETHGDDVTCEIKGEVSGPSVGATVFVGYSPEVSNFTCETSNLSVLVCKWIQGRDANLQGDRQTKYFLNGSSCLGHQCSIKINPNQGEGTWMLTAQNAINTTSVTYTADPRQRVHLPAPWPVQLSQRNSRNANLEWRWNDPNLISLPMRCQVKISAEGEKAEEREESDKGLHSMALLGLHPDTGYAAQVRCTSDEHFWRWGEWSKPIKFQTNKEVPQAVDVWMTVTNNNSLVIWKKLTTKQSHGPLTKYQLSWNGLIKEFEPTQHCYIISSKQMDRITVRALNSVGASQPSTMMAPKQAADVQTSRVNGSGDVSLSWSSRPEASCGYIMEWLPVDARNNCAVEWMKLRPNRTSITITSGLTAGVRYTFSLYSCTSDAPKLIQKWEGYSKEQVPDKGPSIQAVQEGQDVRLTWDTIPLSNQRGFIQGYEIVYALSSQTCQGEHKKVNIVGNEARMQKIISGLSADTYVFCIKAYNSAGLGKPTETSITLDSQVYRVIVYAAISLGAVIMLILLVTVLCYQERAWLKAKVYPEIPSPHLDWTDAKGIRNCELFELPNELVEQVLASPINPNDVRLKDTQGVTSIVPTTSEDSSSETQLHSTDNEFISSVEIPHILTNPTYNLPLQASEDYKVPQQTTAVAKENYKPQHLQSPPSLSPLCLASSSYQSFEGISQQPTIALTGEYTAWGSVGSPTSISSTAPLLEDRNGAD